MFSFFWKNNSESEKKSKLSYYSPKGVKIDFCQFPNFSKIDGRCVAQLGICGSTSWSFSLERQNDKVTVGVHCQPKNKHIADSDKWSVVGDVVVRLLNQNPGEKPLMLSAPKTEFHRKEGKESHWSHTYEGIINEKKGFLKDDTVIFHVQIGIVSMEELYAGNFIDFSVPRENESNLVLLVEGTKFHVSRQILSIQSPVFNTMFNGNFVEAEMKEITIEKVDVVAFHLLLQYIYMAPITICEENVAEMLELADRFLVKRLIRECENFLKKCEMEEKQVIELAIMFNLERFLCDMITEKNTLAELVTSFPATLFLPPTADMYLSAKLVDLEANVKMDSSETYQGGRSLTCFFD